MLWEEVVTKVNGMSREELLNHLKELELYCGYYERLSEDNMRRIATNDIYEMMRSV